MLEKKVYSRIGLLILIICAAGFLALRSDVPTEPIIIYKAIPLAERLKTQTNTATSETEQERHYPADVTFHAEPPRKETSQEKFDREMLEKMERKDQKIAALKAELETVKARNAERTKYLSHIMEKGEEFVHDFQDVLAMNPDKYLALSKTEQEDFLLQCGEYDLFIQELQGIIHSMPQWIIDELNQLRPGEVDDFLNLPLLRDLYGRL